MKGFKELNDNQVVKSLLSNFMKHMVSISTIIISIQVGIYQVFGTNNKPIFFILLTLNILTILAGTSSLYVNIFTESNLAKIIKSRVLHSITIISFVLSIIVLFLYGIGF